MTSLSFFGCFVSFRVLSFFISVRVKRRLEKVLPLLLLVVFETRVEQKMKKVGTTKTISTAGWTGLCV